MEIITKSAFAQRLRVTKGRVSQLVKKGLPVRSDGRLNAEEASAWVETHVNRLYWAVRAGGVHVLDPDFPHSEAEAIAWLDAQEAPDDL